jgi:hypothetical protein
MDSEVEETGPEKALCFMTETQKELVSCWYTSLQAAKEAKRIIAVEKKKRDALVKEIFDHPKEGTNKATMPNGWMLKFTYKVERKIDETLLGVVRDSLESVDISMDTVIEKVPKLNTAVYKKFPKEHQKIVDLCLTSKAGSHTLELVPPKATDE